MTHYKRIEEVATREQLEALDALHVAIMGTLAKAQAEGKALPWETGELPDIRVIDDITYPGASGDRKSPYYMVSDKTVYIQASHLTGQGKKLENLSIAEAALSPQELAAIMAHEYGHHFLPHAAVLEQIAKDNGLNPVTMLASRRAECQADHFTRYFVPDAGVHLAQALGKMQDGYIRDFKGTGSTHPGDVSRVQNTEAYKDFLKNHVPGSVAFTGQCVPDLREAAPPVTPVPPPSDLPPVR